MPTHFSVHIFVLLPVLETLKNILPPTVCIHGEKRKEKKLLWNFYKNKAFT